VSTTRTEERPITGRTVTIELPQAVAARFAQRSPLSSGRDERALIIACQDAVDPAPAIPVAHLDHDALIALAREEISSDRRPSVRAYEDEHNARIRSARARCDELGIEWREVAS